MEFYWLLFLAPCLAAFGGSLGGSVAESGRPWGLGFQFYFVVLLLLVGLRHQVGGDWFSYLEPVELALNQNLSEALALPGDLAYNTLAWLSAHAGTGVYGVNILCAGLFSYGLMVFCQTSPRPWLSLAVAAPYLVIVVAMGYTRQGVAIGLVMMGLVALDKGKILKFVVWVSIASLFHKTALILIPLAIFAGRTNWVALVGLLLTTVMLFFFLLEEHLNHLVAGYLIDQYSSSGAAIRIAMNALPATVFLLYRKRFDLTNSQRVFWTWMALGGLAFIGLLAISPSSTAVDRVALYWIPMQLFVWSRWPDAMTQSHNSQLIWVALVLFYSLVVQFIWLFYSEHSYAWLPYQFYPWVLLWQ